MRFLPFALVALLALPGLAETQGSKQARLLHSLQQAGLSPGRAVSVKGFLANVFYYDTAVELLAATPSDGAMAFAIDTDALYLRANSSWVALSSASGFLGSNGGTLDNEVNNIWEFNENSEGLLLTFGSNLVTFSSDSSATFAFTPEVSFAAGITSPAPALLLHEVRFCGNGHAGADDHFMGPVPLDDTEADLAVGGAGCDALDAAAVGDADAALMIGTDMAFKPVAMVCSAKCTGATAANDAVTFALYDDTAAVSGMTCTTAALGGDGVAAQCTVSDPTPATVAAGSLMAVQVAGTDDACADAGDDFECLLFVTF